MSYLRHIKKKGGNHFLPIFRSYGTKNNRKKNTTIYPALSIISSFENTKLSDFSIKGVLFFLISEHEVSQLTDESVQVVPNLPRKTPSKKINM